MPLGVGSGFWGVILPLEQTNLLLNPSFERGTAGAFAIQSAALGSAANKQQFGAWSCFVVPNSNGTSGAVTGTWTAGNGTAYTVSAYVNAVSGVPMMIGVGDSSGLNLLGSTAFTGGGTWARYSYGFTEAAGAVRSVVIRKTSGNDVGTYYVDGQNAVAGSLTTPIDGDMDGCTWNGAVHASTSIRSGQYRGGGSVVALADLGFQVDQMPGAGMPPIEVSTDSYAIIDGAQFQRQRAAERNLTLTVKPLMGTSQADLHITRRVLIDAWKPDLVTPQQPVRFVYVGGQGTVQLDAYYASGMDMGEQDGFNEDAAVKFVATDPYWRAPTQEGTALKPRGSLQGVNYMVLRNPLGGWGTASGTVQGGAVRALYETTDGTVYAGGQFTSVAGTTAPNIARYTIGNDRFGTLVGGTIGVAGVGIVYDLAVSPAGTIYGAGSFATVAGTSYRHTFQWNGNFGTLAAGTANGAVLSLAYSPTGTLFLGGGFLELGGTTADFVGQWTGANYGTLGGGTVNGTAYGLGWGLDKRLYIGGGFTNIAGSALAALARWNGTMTAAGSALGASGGAPLAYDVAVGPNGVVYAVGQFGTEGGNPGIFNAAQYNGVQTTAMGVGIGLANGVEAARVAYSDPSTGKVYAAGALTSIGTALLPLRQTFTIWNGASWVPGDISIGDPTDPNNFIFAFLRTKAKYLVLGGGFSGTAQIASVGTLINTGRAQAYPTLSVYNNSAGTARVYQLVNYTTGDAIYFNLSLLAQETATLVLTPGNRSLTSDFAGNIFGAILPGSDLATWRMLPGTNYISFFADNDSVQSTLVWAPRHHSIDGGTIY